MAPLGASAAASPAQKKGGEDVSTYHDSQGDVDEERRCENEPTCLPCLTQGLGDQDAEADENEG